MADSPSPRFGSHLRRERLAAGLSQEELAEVAGLSAGAVQALETGRRATPRPGTVRMLADALGLEGERRTALLAAARPEADPTESSGDGFAPPPSTTDGRPSLRLPPHPPTRLINRERELASLLARLGDKDPGAGRLVTLTGPGGVGKTRLALAGAEALSGAFADGVAWVDLAPLRDHVHVGAAIAAALGVRDDGPRDLQAALRASLRDRDLLLVLDNFEHVIEAAPMIAELLADCWRLRVLATSRERLRLRGEQEEPVEPLAVPPANGSIPPSTDPAAGSAAVQLFVERAAEVVPGFAPDAATMPAVAEICRRLEGIPLAIELAAMRVRHLSPAALLGRLDRRLPMLTGGARDLPARHRTMHAAVAWSYDLLSPHDQRLFRRLTVFAGGFGPEEATDVAEADGDVGDPTAALDGLCRLADQSLLRRPPEPVDEQRVRFVMLETMREFALEQLGDAGEADVIHRRHADHFARLAEAAEAELTGPRQGEWLDRLESEHDNLRAALAWAIVHAPATALRLGAALWRFWWQRGHFGDGRRWLERALAADEATGAAPARLRLRALYGAGSLADVQGDFPRAEAWHTEGLALARREGDRLAEIRALNGLGLAASGQGDDARAAPLFEEVLAVARRLDEPLWIANGALNLGEAVARLGDLPRGRDLLAEALALHRARGHAVGVIYTLAHLGAVTLALGDRDGAFALLREAMADARVLGTRTAMTEVLVHFGHAVAADDPVTAARVLGAAAALNDAIGAAFDPLLPAEHERAIADLRAALGDDGFATAWAAGRTLTPDAAAAEALAAGGERAQGPAPSPRAG